MSIKEFEKLSPFKLAKNVSKYSNYPLQMGAVIVDKNHPIAVGFNIKKTHPTFANPEITISGCIHAEIRAIMNCGFEVTGCDIYIYREHKDAVPALARPCEMCYNILKDYGIKRIFYTINEYPYYKVERI